MMRFKLIADLDSQERADKYLHSFFSEQEDLAHLSRSQIQKLLETGEILIDGKTFRSKDIIPPGSEIQIHLPAPVQLDVVPENIPIQVLFEDEHLIVINKQPGLTVHPSSTQVSGTLVNALLHHVKDLSGIGGKLRPGIVHRIDKNTSGALVISKNDETHLGLSKLFATHTIDRKYWAFAYGVPKIEDSLRVETTLGRHPNDRKKMAVNVEGGRKAISHFKVLREYGVPHKTPFASWVEATLETGRTHQIRVHLNHLGNSILGDTIYGTPSENAPKWKILPTAIQLAVQNLPGQALHARVLGFKHPITGQNLYFEAEPFDDFKNLQTALQKFES